MPEYLSPGVYVEEVSFRSNIIEGLSTTTTAFVGPTRYGPIDLEPALLTSLADFEAIYGDGTQLDFSDLKTINNYMWHAVRAFFTEGGKRLYVARIVNQTSLDKLSNGGFAAFPASGASSSSSSGGSATSSSSSSSSAATSSSSSSGGASASVAVKARYPGAAGDFRVRFTLTLGQNVLASKNNAPTVGSLRDTDVVLVTRGGGSSSSSSSSSSSTASTGFWEWSATAGQFTNGSNTLAVSTLSPTTDKVQVVSVGVTVFPSTDSITTTPLVYTGLALDPAHMTNGAVDSLTGTFVAPDAHNPELARDLPVVITTTGTDGLSLYNALAALTGTGVAVGPASGSATTLDAILKASGSSWVDVNLTGGSDGANPVPTDYGGGEDDVTGAKWGLMRLEDLDDVSIVAAPGSSFQRSETDAVAVMGQLIAHAEKMHYRIAVLDSVNGQGLTAVRSLRAKIDSSYAAFYYPWVRVYDPITQGPLNLPPSGFVCGIYARNDTNRAVYKAPANEVVNLAIGFELLINKGQQDVLNPEGINCFRYFPDRGYRLWGARTASSDPEWMYVNLRRYFAYLEHSVDKGTQWVVFEPNGPLLWDNVRRTVSSFLLNEWQSGALLGDKPEQAFFVRCDRTTMTQNDLDNGRLVCLVGVAALRPAEFVIFRIGQWTGSSST